MMTTQNPYEAPQADISRRGTPAAPPQTWQWLLFSFDGRIPRRSFWGVTLGMIAANFLLGFVVGMVFGESSIGPIIVLAASIPLIWISFAVTIKRWHDRDKSGWWIFIGVIPIIGAIWALIETGCLRGTVGPNSYGPDPT